MSRKITKNKLGEIKYSNFFISICTGMIGYQIHNSVFWGIMNFIFWPISWIKWLIYHEVNLSIIKETFEWFLK